MRETERVTIFLKEMERVRREKEGERFVKERERDSV